MARKQSMRCEARNHMIHRKAEGRSKYNDKQVDKLAHRELVAGEQLDRAKDLQKRYFHTQATFDHCVDRAVDVMRFAKAQNNGKRVPFSECKEYLDDYIAHQKKRAENGEISPRTLASIRSQASKAFLVDLTHCPILPMTTRSQKGRGSDKHWNWDNHKEQRQFYESIGARKNEYRELSIAEYEGYKKQFKEVTGQELKTRSNIQPIAFDKNGNVSMIAVVKAKHGKTNKSVIAPQDRAFVTEMFKNGKYNEFYNPSDHCNVHACRRAYAQKLYKLYYDGWYGENGSRKGKEDWYICRGDAKGEKYEKHCIGQVSLSLGHMYYDHFDTIHNYMR